MKKLLSLLTIIPLTSCVQNALVLNTEIFCFGTFVDVTLNQGNKTNISEIETLVNYYDSFSDSFYERSIANVYTLNHTNEPVQVCSELYDVLSKAKEAKNNGGTYFEPLAGSLSNLWKEALEDDVIPSDINIQEELTKLENSSIDLLAENQIRRNGEAELDLGGIAKGYMVDAVKEYLVSKDIKNYLINAGRSSILVGEKKSVSNGLYRVGLSKEYPNHHIKVKNCFISTSGTSVQGKTIGGVKYSHIINPFNGSAINNYDEVVVVSESGWIGDVLSTSMMMNTIDEIKAIETAQNVKTIVIKDHQLVYCNQDLKVYKN